MKTTKNDMPKALRDVWAWRTSLHQDLLQLPVADLLHALSARADDAAHRLGFGDKTENRYDKLAVAEPKTRYGTG